MKPPLPVRSRLRSSGTIVIRHVHVVCVCVCFMHQLARRRINSAHARPVSMAITRRWHQIVIDLLLLFLFSFFLYIILHDDIATSTAERGSNGAVPVVSKSNDRRRITMTTGQQLCYIYNAFYSGPSRREGTTRLYIYVYFFFNQTVLVVSDACRQRWYTRAL